MDFKHASIDIKTLSHFATKSVSNSTAFLNMLLNVIDEIEAAVCAKDTLGRRYLVNKYYAEAVGLPREELLGKTDDDICFYTPEFAKSIRDTDLKVMANNTKIIIEERIPNIDDELHWYYISKSPIYSHSGKINGVMSLAFDTTKQKDLEEKLQKATQTKNTFLAKMSHEIRTPISAISGYLELAQNSNKNNCNNAECKQYLNKMCNSVDHLLNLVDDILDLSSIEERKIKLNLKNFSVNNLLDSIIDNLQHKALTNNIVIKRNYNKEMKDTLLVGDETRIKQIVFNLVTNAIKYSSDNVIEIRSKIIKSKNSQPKLIFLVKDNGIGIAPEKKRLVFKAFEQLNNSNHFFEGAGLGLSIVKELSKLMGGKVKIFSRLGKGTIVAISLPLQFPASTPNKTKIHPTINHKKNKHYLKNKVICIVEDQAFNREILATLIRLEGATPVMFDDGAELITAIETNQIQQRIDCFLLDVHMPTLSGTETLIRLRNFSQYKDTPAYLVTADAIKSNLESYLASAQSLSGIFIKPIKREQLVSVLHSLL